MEVTDRGAVSLDIAGVRCLDSFQVILPARDWRAGGAVPHDCTRETLAPGHVRVTGTMADQTACATFTLDAREADGGLDLVWELVFTRDLDVETVRLNGYLPCAPAAGKAAWFLSKPTALDWAFLPSQYGQPGGNMGSWGFDWFGWLLPGDRGVRFLPRPGLTDMYLQDGRQWGAAAFATMATVIETAAKRGEDALCVPTSLVTPGAPPAAPSTS